MSKRKTSEGSSSSSDRPGTKARTQDNSEGTSDESKTDNSVPGYAHFKSCLVSLYNQLDVQKTMQQINNTTKKYAEGGEYGSSVPERLQMLCNKLKKKYQEKLCTTSELETAFNQLLEAATSDDLQNCKVCSRVTRCNEHCGGLSKACGTECEKETCGILLSCADIKKCLRGCGNDVLLCKEDCLTCYKCGVSSCKHCCLVVSDDTGCDECEQSCCNECGIPELCKKKCNSCQSTECGSEEPFVTCRICSSDVCNFYDSCGCSTKRLCWTGRPNFDSLSPWENEEFVCVHCSTAHLRNCGSCNGQRSSIPEIQNIFNEMDAIDCCDNESGPWYWIICQCQTHHLPTSASGEDVQCKEKE